MDLAPLKKRKFCDFLKSMFLYGLERLERLVSQSTFLVYFSINEKKKKPQIFYQNHGLTPLHLEKW